MAETVIHRHNDGQGTLTIERVQDCDPIAEWCKRQHNAGFHGSSEMKHAGRIPDVMVEAYCNLKKITFHEFLANREHIRNILNDPALSHFRIWKGAV